MILFRCAFLLALVCPVGAMLLLSLSPSSGMDFYARPSDASLKWWAELFGDDQWLEATLTSIVVAFACTIISLSIAAPAAARWRLTMSSKRSLALSLSTISFVLPPVVLAVALYMAAVRVGLFDNLPGLIVVHLAITLPLSIFVLRQRLANQSTTAYHTARALGASDLQAITTWLRSSHQSTLWAAAGVAFMASMSEATLTLMVTDTHVKPIPQRIVSGLAQDIRPTGYAAMTVWMFVVGIALYVATSTKRGDKNHG